MDKGQRVTGQLYGIKFYGTVTDVRKDFWGPFMVTVACSDGFVHVLPETRLAPVSD